MLDVETLTRFRDRFQFPDETRIHLPCEGEKSCSFTLGEVCFYKAAFLSGLRFPIHPFIMELLHHLNIAFGQLMPNFWRIVISCMEIWMIVTKGDMIRLDEFVHLYCLTKLKEFGYYELVLGRLGSLLIFLRLFDTRSLDTSLYQVMVGRLPLMNFGVRFLGCFVGGGPRN